MGKYPRRKQKRLAEKLLQIRLILNLSQNEMLRHLGLENEISRTNISNYELGQREPPLYVLLAYAKAANVWIDVLVDDGLDLPAKIPSPRKFEGLRRISVSGRKKA
ncbi:MAG TPA: helix-turn-helix domain-containing protein [Flavisolibacter sp.]|nr:helix-turn-helix domain-containing protein [Flavisolibacter sp.]